MPAAALPGIDRAAPGRPDACHPGVLSTFYFLCSALLALLRLYSPGAYPRFGASQRSASLTATPRRPA